MGLRVFKVLVALAVAYLVGGTEVTGLTLSYLGTTSRELDHPAAVQRVHNVAETRGAASLKQASQVDGYGATMTLPEALPPDTSTDASQTNSTAHRYQLLRRIIQPSARETTDDAEKIRQLLSIREEADDEDEGLDGMFRAGKGLGSVGKSVKKVASSAKSGIDKTVAKVQTDAYGVGMAMGIVPVPAYPAYPMAEETTEPPPRPLSCVWDEWGSWGACTATCGGGQRPRTREKLREASNGGEECEGEDLKTGDCATEECPSTTTATPPALHARAEKSKHVFTSTFCILFLSATYGCS